MPADYTKLWEAWVGGWEGTSGLDPGQDVGSERIKDFYSQVVGPAWGGEYVEGEKEFGTTFENYISEFDTQDLERAEREFRMSIGDPYKYGADPFAWERISRMEPNQAQIQLEAELFGQGKRLGGETGAEYGTSMSTALEGYTSGIEGTRESLTYEGLEGGQGLASGTSGAVLRSGQGVSVAEDVLIEAYKKTKDAQAGYEEGKVGIESTLESDLNQALTTYMDRIREEKEDWYGTIARDVTRATDREMDYEFSVSEVGEDWGVEEGYTEGLEYQQDEQWFMEDEACDIGEVRAPDESGGYSCQVASELGLEYDDYGALCPSGNIDCAGVCGGDAIDQGCGCGNGKPAYRCSNGSYQCGQEDCPAVEGEPSGGIEMLEEEVEEVDEGFSGCMDPTAHNYDPGATVDDGSCYQAEGCTNPEASNYSSTAITDDGSCTFTHTDEPQVSGCTNPLALNYNDSATVDDFSCQFCTDSQIRACEKSNGTLNSQCQCIAGGGGGTEPADDDSGSGGRIRMR